MGNASAVRHDQQQPAAATALPQPALLQSDSGVRFTPVLTLLERRVLLQMWQLSPRYSSSSLPAWLRSLLRHRRCSAAPRLLRRGRGSLRTS